MALYTLCPNYLDFGCSDNNDFVDVLLSFCQTNSRKVAFDDKDKMVDSYRRHVKNQENLNIWLRYLTMKENNFEIVSVDFVEGNDENTELVITVAKNTYDKTIACKTKSDYLKLNETITAENINLLDKDELKQSFISTQTKIIQKTSGNNSPIISGDDNQIGK